MGWLFKRWDLLLLLLCAAIFILYPQLDLISSHLFYKSSSGFFLKDHAAVLFLRQLTPVVVGVLMLGLGGLLLASLVPAAHRLRTQRKAMAYLLLALVLGPGLMVNTVFKDHWGRARPSQVQEFGGDKVFSPAIIPTDQCARNCSFVSGDASVGFYFVSLAFVFTRRRKFWHGLGLSYGGILGVGRMMQGGHFLSDVIFSYFTVYFTALILYELMYRLWPRLQRSVFS